MLENYQKYLDFVNSKLDKFFAEQEPYIFCKKGCAKCCQNAEFPYSLLEIQYFVQGVSDLDETTQDIINKKIAKLNHEKDNFKGERFLYDCPFLIDGVCSMYKYRGLVCRSFGLITSAGNDRTNVPFCYEKGLNYSNVVDLDKNMITQEKCDALGYEKKPKAYNVSYDFLTNENMEKAFDIKFGDKKPLLEWFDDIR